MNYKPPRINWLPPELIRHSVGVDGNQFLGENELEGTLVRQPIFPVILSVDFSQDQYTRNMRLLFPIQSPHVLVEMLNKIKTHLELKTP